MRLILAQVPKQLAHLYLKGIIMQVIKPLYRIIKVGTY